MRWRQGRRSINIENRRGLPVKTAAGGGGLLLMAFIVYLAGGDPTGLLVEGLGQSLESYQSQLSPEEEKEQTDFASVVLAGTEDAWQRIFAKNGWIYKDPSLVLFLGITESACGTGQAASGPFYCPLDQKIYLDLNFFHELEYRFGAPGDFARAYVIAHEVGHHVQQQTGIFTKLQMLQHSVSQKEANRLSVVVELQADCYAGVWAYVSEGENILETGDIEEALQAAGQIGDDRLQEESQGYIVPDSFTHGSSQQRYEAFWRGYTGGNPKACDAFKI